MTLSVLCSRKFPVAKKLIDKKNWKVSRFCVKKNWSHSAEKIHTVILCVSLTSGIENRLQIRVGVLEPRFSGEIVLSRGNENFVGEPFFAVFQKVSGSEKLLSIRGRGRVSRFCAEIILS